MNPKANITSVTLSGNPIVGDEVSAVVSGIPEKRVMMLIISGRVL